MRVLIAPDKFKGTMTARVAGKAIERGLRSVSRGLEVRHLPMADGGEGTIDVLGRLPVGSVCIEVASTSGSVTQPDARQASSEATGRALARSFDQKPDRILVAIGGSSSTDGGVGIARSVGWRFLDNFGHELAPGGASLRDLARIDGGGARRPPSEIIGLCDVSNPLLGPTGAARTFGPQKGASPHDVDLLEQGLTRLAEMVHSQLGVDIAELPGAGAGGGIGAGLAAFFGARLVDGFGFIADVVGLGAAIAEADAVVTGEGRLDQGSLSGKVTSGVARMARALEVPVLAVCGEIALSDAELEGFGFKAWADASSIGGRERALTHPEESVVAAARRVAERAEL